MSHPVVITLLILAVIAALALAAEVLKPLALSVLLAFALTPVANFFQRRMRLPRPAAVVLTVLLALGAIGGFGYVVGRQLTALAGHVEQYKDNVVSKVARLKPGDQSALDKARRLADEVARQLTAPPVLPGPVTNVRVVQQPDFRERLQAAVGPYLEFLGVGSFVLILALFMMANREDLRDRVVAVFGHGRVSLTTRTMDEIGRRISRYLATFATVNSGFGLVIGLGLWAIGVPYAVLWGCLAALLRFIPYVGPAAGLALPLLFSVAYFPGWRQSLEVLALFGVVEVALNSFLEPVIYGKTTGVSALGLLVAAMFWAWLWGLLGILLSTPLTVCLAVLGKYVPSLGVFATLLGEEADLEPDVRFYQRLVALDGDGASEVVEAALRSRPRSEVCDSILVPALSRAERDAQAGTIDDVDLAFIERVIGDLLDDLEGTLELTLETVAAGDASANGHAAGDGRSSRVDPGAPPPAVMGVAAGETADGLVLRMLALLLEPSGLKLEAVTDAVTPLALAERVDARSPALVVLSHLPPGGLTAAKYQVRRLRARFPDLPIVVGRWGAAGGAAQLAEVGASHVAVSLAEARDQIIARVRGETAGRAAAEPAGGLVKAGP
jgi:predicted PurR-regulated permease PerM